LPAAPLLAVWLLALLPEHNSGSMLNKTPPPSDVIQIVSGLLRSAATSDARFPPTLLYNEGWMLRLVLTLAEHGFPCLPFLIAPNARWFSEALLPSAFLPRFRGDRLAESWTHADGALGHFQFRPESKAGLSLQSSGTQFVVLEAKVFSSLSKGTVRAPAFDQAARNVACIAEVLRRCGAPFEQWDSLAFHVLAPQSQIDTGVFAKEMSVGSIRSKILERISVYEPETRSLLEMWFQQWVDPLLGRITISCVSWESIIANVREASPPHGESLEGFYSKTLQYNRPPDIDRG
jgi:hypothetical protein